ncbi:MAG: universal stress protein [Gammaproteobacteria bacterium]
MRFNHLLAYLDTRRVANPARTRACLASLADLAAAHDARLTLCDVLEPPPAAAGRTSERVAALRGRYVLTALEHLAAELRGRVVAEYVLLEGSAFIAVSRHAARHGIDLVAVLDGTDGDGRPDATARHLVRKCPAPVWVMGPRGHGARQRLLVAVDRDIFPATAAPRDMAGRLVDAAIALARAQPASLHLAHAWQVYGAELMEDPGLGLDAADLEAYVDSQRYSHHLWLEELHDALRARLAARGEIAFETTTHLIEGDAAEVLPALARRLAVDALLLGTLGASRAPGVLIGNTAEEILGRVGVPILALKPPGFESPLMAPDA